MSPVNTSIEKLPNTSRTTIKRLKFLGVNSFFDLLNYFPFRYENYSLISTIDKLQPGEIVTIQGRIIEAKNEVTRRGMRIQKVIIDDGTGRIEVIWYNQPYLIRLFKPSPNLSVAGEVGQFGKRLLMEAFQYELLDFNVLKHQSRLSLKHTGRIIPIYPEKKGLSSRIIREKIFYILSLLNNHSQDGIKEVLPAEIVAYNQLLDELSAYKNIHFPKDLETAKKARQRLAFDELFTIQLSASLIKKEWEKEVVANQFKLDSKTNLLLTQFIANLPFRLTKAQKKALDEILTDLGSTHPMNRLLQGEVGSGKTVVATICCYLTYLHGYQSLLMAPTEILAFQHYETVSKLLSPFNVSVALITGSKKDMASNIKDKDVIIGTQSLLNKNLKFNRVGFVIIDEQHRFGVIQRAMLKEKGINPHLLTMTATPIPRTVALTLYGELELSVIDEMPVGRGEVKTFLVPKEKRQSGYRWIKEMIKKEKVQAFIICPLIEESFVETMKSVKAAKKEYEYLKNIVFPEFKIGLIHGRLKSKEKNQVMSDFKNKVYDILVSTSMVEVGIDIPNATIMLIEAAERYGLAQLHQLRGRVGRGEKQSYCLLFTEMENEKIISRLNFFVNCRSGIALSEYDLRLRGPGEVYESR